jgi:ferric-dicitrate binding protein FerR (iron transport regulator)
MAESEGSSGEAWSAALDQARTWLERLGERDDGRTSREFAAWLEAAPMNTEAFTAACAESLRSLARPR